VNNKIFKSANGDIPLPIFFPDATRAVIRSLDSVDIENTKTLGVLVNTYHLLRELGADVIKKFGGIRNFMDWQGGVISDSGGFQVMSLIKKGEMQGRITKEGVTFHPVGEKKMLLTPEKSIRFQMSLATDMVVVLDDFTDPAVNHDQAEISVERTIDWAKRSKDEYEKICKEKKLTTDKRPYLLGVVQGGEFQDLREHCTKELVKIGFDGLGYGGWPIDQEGHFDFSSAQTIADNTPKDYFLYGLGVGKPDEIVKCARMGFNIFDCVLPTRDARHGRLYIFAADSIDQINLKADKFFSYYSPDKERYYYDETPVSSACDCLLCKNYSRAYIAHLFRTKEITAMRLATIHNLRFYSLLMEKLRVLLTSEKL
jgi:queuine tRNA-ribosyltransferase